MRKHSVQKELKTMSGTWAGSDEITIPQKIIKDFLDFHFPNTTNYGSFEGSIFMAWVNKKKNIEMRFLSSDYEANGIFVTCLVRKHGGSIAITFPYIIKDMFKMMKKPLKKFKIFVNRKGNIEFEPVFSK